MRDSQDEKEKKCIYEFKDRRQVKLEVEPHQTLNLDQISHFSFLDYTNL